MRTDYEQFTSAGASVVAIAPEGIEAVQKYVARNEAPYPIVSDADHKVFDAYDVASRALSLGQRPALFVVDRDGIVRWETVGTQQWQIPTNKQVIDVLADLNG